jgi:hypothetical protein
MDDEINKSEFRDFIPASEESSAYTDTGYQDFVPAAEPQFQTIDETVETPVAPEEITPLPVDEEDTVEQDEVSLPEGSGQPEVVEESVVDAPQEVTTEASQWDAQNYSDPVDPVVEQASTEEVSG